MNRAKQANYILQDQGLLNELKQYGTPHIIGSYKMDLMAWNDLDIYVENDLMSLNKLHNLTKFILDSFNPTWYEAKEEVDKQGSKGWFQGFEFYLNKELWNVDIWFLNKYEIEKAEKYCDNIAKKVNNDERLRTAIIEIKQELIKRDLYSFDKYTSMNVYDAVLNQGILNVDGFIKDYLKF